MFCVYSARIVLFVKLIAAKLQPLGLQFLHIAILLFRALSKATGRSRIILYFGQFFEFLLSIARGALDLTHVFHKIFVQVILLLGICLCLVVAAIFFPCIFKFLLIATHFL